jgi:hypothetical protein
MKQILFIIIFLGVLCNYTVQAQNSTNNKHIVDIVAEEYAFQAPSEIPSGWSTIRLSNKGEESHFVFLTRLPEGKTFDNYMEDVAVLFDEVWKEVESGKLSKTKATQELGSRIPKWFYQAVRMGGSGLLEGGATTEVTLKLEPGNYFMECYMKTEEGEFHAMEGMARPFTVTQKSTGIAPPTADITLTLSNFEMMLDGDLTSGTKTISVHVKEHPEVGYGHNVHVARLEPDTDIDNLVRWMNYLEIDGLRTPSPTTFTGGLHIMPEGETGYFNIDLKPGRYLFVSEATGHLGVMKEVTVEKQ